MPLCCVPQRPNYDAGIRFPTRDHELRKCWIVAVKREKWTPTPYSVVYKKHFTEEDYIGITNSVPKHIKFLEGEKNETRTVRSEQKSIEYMKDCFGHS